MRNFCRQRTDTPWFFLRRANLNNEDRALFVACFLENLLNEVVHDRHPCPRALFTSATDRTAYEKVWRNLFYRTLEELPEAKCNKEQLMRMQPQAQLERLRAVHPQESSKDAFILAFNALPQEERLSRYRPLQAFLDFWPRLGFTWLAASLCDLYYFLHYTCNHLIIENQALEFSVSTLVKRYAQVNPVVGKYLQNIYQNNIVKPYNRYVDFCNGRIGYQCDDQNKFEKISDDQKVFFLALHIAE